MSATPAASLLAALLTGAVASPSPQAGMTAPAPPSPIDLATALRLAGANGVEIQVARERLEAARAGTTSALTQFLPWLSAGAAYRAHGGLTQDVVGNVVEADKNAHTVGAALNLQVDVGDAVYQTLAARQARAAAEQQLEARRQEALLRAAQAYFDLLVAQAVVQVTSDALGISRGYESQLHRAVEAGIALKGDELRVSVQTHRNRLALQQAQEQRRVLAARLAEALRLDAATDLVAQDVELAPLALVPATESIESLVAEAVAQRPEVKESLALERVADEARKGAVYGPLVPTVAGQASLANLGGGRDGGPTASGSSRDYVAVVGWRIGPGGLFDLGRIRATRARLGEAHWNAERLKDGVAREVVEARARVLSQQEQVATAREALGVADQGLQLARGRREFEVGVVLENILAEQDQTRARQDYVRAIGEFDKAQYALARALGRLGRVVPPAAP